MTETLCSECKRLFPSPTLRNLAHTQNGGMARCACPVCYALVIGIRKQVRQKNTRAARAK